MRINIKPFKPRPELLTTGQAPKALYGVNPRSIMGEEAWDKLRKQVYRESLGRCACCGDNPEQAPMEAHELYDIDYEQARCYLVEVVAMCSLCHLVAHRDIHERSNHGSKTRLKKALYHCRDLLKQAKRRNSSKENKVPWYKWRLVWEGKEYPPIHEPY